MSSVIPFLWRNIKWRFHNAFTIVITILQPMLWLVLYSAVAGQFMKGIGIANYTAFMLPGLMVLVSFGCCSSSGIMNYIMKTDGSFYRVLIAPVKRSAIVTGQILEAVLCAFLEVGIMAAVSIFFSVKIASGFTGYAADCARRIPVGLFHGGAGLCHQLDTAQRGNLRNGDECLRAAAGHCPAGCDVRP